MSDAEKTSRLFWYGRGLWQRPAFLKTRAASSPTVSEQNSRPRYRPDIDGLRALAVLAVVAYHVFPALAPGGFVGVDVFFVISGFLISTIIFKSLASGKFSFLEFYAHRVRRIFPALILVMAVCLFFGWNTLLANEFIYLGKHIAASAGFVQNLLLWGETGYFDIASELKPLNHLWSLAIEEQFYLVFPLLLWCAWRAGLNLLAAVALIGILSFAANLYGAYHDPIGTFFSLQTRAWELMVGAVAGWLALYGIRAYETLRPQGSSLAFWPNSVLSCVGLLLILIAIFGLDKTVPYPGVLALLPVLGAALLLLSGHMAWTNRIILSNRVPVFVGLISYPLYLWHWPLLSYLTIVDGGQPSLYQRTIVAVLSLVLAWLTYQFVELPLRTKEFRRKWTVTNLIVGMSILMALGVKANLLYRKYDEQTQKVMQAWEFRGYPGAEGMYRDEKFNFPTIGHNDKRRILFFGDSHADQYQFLLGDLLKRWTSEGVEAPEVMFPPNTEFPPDISKKVLDDRTISAAVLSYFWALTYYSDKVNQPIRCCGKGLMGTVGRRVKPLTAEEMDRLDDQLTSVVRALRESGKQVYFLLDNPFGEEFSPRFLAKRSFFHGITIISTPVDREKAIERAEPVRSRILEIARKTGSKLIDPFASLCDALSCPVLSAEGLPINKDYDHLSENTVVNHVRYLDILFAPEPAK
jgi:peptidoglycan/LPS O-acetylase OafA/YrhL